MFDVQENIFMNNFAIGLKLIYSFAKMESEDDRKSIESYEKKYHDADVDELLISLLDDILELITTISEDNFNTISNIVMENKEDAMSAVKGILDTKSVTLLVSGFSKLMMIPTKIDQDLVADILSYLYLIMITTTAAINLARRLSSLKNYMRIAKITSSLARFSVIKKLVVPSPCIWARSDLIRTFYINTTNCFMGAHILK